MKKTITFLSCAGLALFITSCANQFAQKTPASPREVAVESKVFASVNKEREAQGSKDLQRYASLDVLARQHSTYMRDNRKQLQSGGAEIFRMGYEGRALTAKRICHFSGYSENVAYTPPGLSDSAAATSALGAWKRNPVHQAVVVRPSWTHCGVGVAEDKDGTVFVTQIYGTADPFIGTTRRDQFNQH